MKNKAVIFDLGGNVNKQPVARRYIRQIKIIAFSARDLIPAKPL